jgi:hypothetical protein
VLSAGIESRFMPGHATASPGLWHDKGYQNLVNACVAFRTCCENDAPSILRAGFDAARVRKAVCVAVYSYLDPRDFQPRQRQARQAFARIK